MYTNAPSKETPATSFDTDGYEWCKSESGADYYRTAGSQQNGLDLTESLHTLS